MSEISITAVQYMANDNNENTTLRATIDGVERFVPLDPANRHYAEIMRQVEAGELTIADAD